MLRLYSVSTFRILIHFFLFKVNGGWAEWEDWKDCPVTCGGSNQSRIRLCDNPEPAFGGKHCTDDGSIDSESQRCNENACPGTILILYMTNISCAIFSNFIPIMKNKPNFIL